jgi:hypothetical protein
MADKSLKYSLERNLGHLAFARSVLWLVSGTVLLDFFTDKIQDDLCQSIFYGVCQFYVLFAIYAYMQLLEGLKIVSSVLLKVHLGRKTYFLGESQRFDTVSGGHCLFVIGQPHCNRLLFQS